MKVIVIRHGKVDFKWNSWSTSEQYERDCKNYDKASIIPSSLEIPKDASKKIYISSLSRSRETAVQIFGEKNFIMTKLIDEVPIHPCIVSKVKLPLLFWNISGRLQWLLHNRRQPECRRDTIHRAEQFVKRILQNEEDCTVVTHGFFMHILIGSLKKNKFSIDRAKLKYSNGEYMIAKR